MSKNIPQRILIVGGGSAGWVAANLFLEAWGKLGVDISLIESSEVSTIRVGEGSTPHLKRFFTTLGVSEREWMPACNATYKAGIRFVGWSKHAGYESYFHPFCSGFDRDAAGEFFRATDGQRNGRHAGVHPDQYFLPTQLAREQLSPVPVPAEEFSDQVEYGYHFDAGLLAKFLRSRAIAQGLRHYDDHVTSVARSEDGAIAHVETRQSGNLSADLYIDCTGFSRLLIGQALGEKLIPFKENLFNDSAITIQTPVASSTPITPQTVSHSLSAGWAWEIPLYNRYGHGYVYSSDFLSAEEAEREFRQHLGLLEADVPARHLKMSIGRIENHWKANCLAVGLSQGLIEPLEATGLMATQKTVENLILYLTKASEVNTALKNHYNLTINNLFEGIRDYIVSHYFVATREDTEYWRACREQCQPSAALTSLLEYWDGGGNFFEELTRQGSRQIYDVTSWYCLLTGYGRFPRETLQPPCLDMASGTVAFQDFVKHHGSSFLDHRQQLENLYQGASA